MKKLGIFQLYPKALPVLGIPKSFYSQLSHHTFLSPLRLHDLGHKKKERLSTYGEIKADHMSWTRIYRIEPSLTLIV